jgi:hypothetical protein
MATTTTKEFEGLTQRQIDRIVRIRKERAEQKTVCECCEEHADRPAWKSHGVNVCAECDNFSDYESDDGSDDGFEDCEDCGYTHHYEDKCPKGENCKHYKKWRDEDGSEDKKFVYEPQCYGCGDIYDLVVQEDPEDPRYCEDCWKIANRE